MALPVQISLLPFPFAAADDTRLRFHCPHQTHDHPANQTLSHPKTRSPQLPRLPRLPSLTRSLNLLEHRANLPARNPPPHRHSPPDPRRFPRQIHRPRLGHLRFPPTPTRRHRPAQPQRWRPLHRQSHAPVQRHRRRQWRLLLARIQTPGPLHIKRQTSLKLHHLQPHRRHRPATGRSILPHLELRVPRPFQHLRRPPGRPPFAREQPPHQRSRHFQIPRQNLHRHRRQFPLGHRHRRFLQPRSPCSGTRHPGRAPRPHTHARPESRRRQLHRPLVP